MPCQVPQPPSAAADQFGEKGPISCLKGRKRLASLFFDIWAVVHSLFYFRLPPFSKLACPCTLVKEETLLIIIMFPRGCGC
jgi:hypothetical protein